MTAGRKSLLYTRANLTMSRSSHKRYASGSTHQLFLNNKESVEGMLVRKFKAKFIDSNPAFAKDPVNSVSNNLTPLGDAALHAGQNGNGFDGALT